VNVVKIDRKSPYVVRWRENGRHHSRSFRTLREAREFDAAMKRVKRERETTDLERQARQALEEER
jgi:hypothetical protein